MGMGLRDGIGIWDVGRAAGAIPTFCAMSSLGFAIPCESRSPWSRSTLTSPDVNPYACIPYAVRRCALGQAALRQR